MANRFNGQTDAFRAMPGSPDDPRLNGIGRPRMTPAERAKIFMPFNPLKGFQEALREKEAEAEAHDAALFHENPFD